MKLDDLPEPPITEVGFKCLIPNKQIIMSVDKNEVRKSINSNAGLMSESNPDDMFSDDFLGQFKNLDKLIEHLADLELEDLIADVIYYTNETFKKENQIEEVKDQNREQSKKIQELQETIREKTNKIQELEEKISNKIEKLRQYQMDSAELRGMERMMNFIEYAEEKFDDNSY